MDDDKRLKEKCAERKARNPVGRPKGGSLAQKMLNDLVASKDFEKAIKAMGKILKDEDHRHWPQTMKMILDREAHISHYEKDGSSGKTAININISGIGVKVEETVEAEFEEVND